jgi:TonB family protein
MFDKLVESDTAGAEFKNRSRYFMVSSIVVGILFLTAVVYSLYAADIGLGNGNFEIAELISPVAAEAPEPERPRDQPVSSESSTTPRNVNSNMARIDEPTIAPTGISADQNKQPSRGTERFNPLLPESFGNGSSGTSGRRETTGSSSGVPDTDTDEPNARTAEPPPAIKKPPTILRTSNVLNGSAISLPKPAYPRPAIALSLEGTVKIQVTIDETGNVISAKAADGHPFFRQVAEQAARNAKFRPTLLNDVPVKVTGVIVYNFRRTN